MSYTKDYVHFVPQSKKDSRFPDAYEYVLIESIDQLKEVLTTEEKYIAWDLETTGLNPETSEIVGIAFCMDGKTTYYLPIHHIAQPFLGREGLEVFYEALFQFKTSFVFNMRFDYRFMEHAEFDMSKLPYFDVSVAVWFADTNHKMPSLKWSAKHFLGWDMQTFEETLGDSYNFYYLDPKDAVFYAGSDALSTYHLAGKCLQYYKEGRTSAKLDNRVLYPLMKFEDAPLLIDYQYLEKVLVHWQSYSDELEKDVFSMVGYDFNIGSGKQLADALSRLGFDTGEYTKAGYMRTPMNLLEKLEQETGHPIMRKLVEYKELSKSISSYIGPLAKYSRDKGGALRFSYHTAMVPTGRLACGSDKKNDYFAKVNAQSIPKPAPHLYSYREATTEEIARGEGFLGYIFSEDTEEYPEKVEGFSKVRNVRRAFLPGEDHYWVSIDFRAQELRIPTNITKEPVWLEAFLGGQDIHERTGRALFGNDLYDSNPKYYRGLAKVANFGILYGMSKYSLMEKFNMKSLEEAEAFIATYKQTLSSLFAWVTRHCNKTKKQGYCHTFFGRPRRVKYYFQHPEGSQRAFGYRTAVNTVIQGAGADILKIALLKLWDEVLNHPDYRDDVRFLVTVHDEINFGVRKERLFEILPLLVKNMELEIPTWMVPMEVGVEIGNTWGDCFPFYFQGGRWRVE